jgi:hypothetical protein
MKTKILFLTVLLAASNLFGAYEVKIAKYKNHTFLMLEIAKIKESEYRKNIVIQKRNEFYYVTSAVYESQSEAQKALHVYKKVFEDAFIQEDIKSRAPTATSENTVITEVEKSQIEKPCNAEELLENKTVYLCYENGSTYSQKRIIQMDFEGEYVEYLPLKSTYKPLKIDYTFKDDTVVLVISGIEFAYKIYKKEDKYLAVKSFTNGKKSPYTLRYYFDKSAALEFLDKH